jgi:transcriptional repressor NrdR
VEGGKATKRRRRCPICSSRFTTFERLEITDLIVQKSNGMMELYSREKLERGIWLSCGKLPITRGDVESMIGLLEEKWFEKKEIMAKEIGADVMAALKKLNEIAYIRFASVYREFHDIEDLRKEIQNISYTS